MMCSFQLTTYCPYATGSMSTFNEPACVAQLGKHIIVALHRMHELVVVDRKSNMKGM